MRRWGSALTAMIVVSAFGFVTGACGDDADERSLLVEFEEPTGKEFVQVVYLNGFDDRAQPDESEFVTEQVHWDGITTVVVDLTNAESPCRGAIFGVVEELADLGLGEVVTIAVNGEPAVVNLVGCRDARISAS